MDLEGPLAQGALAPAVGRHEGPVGEARVGKVLRPESGKERCIFLRPFFTLRRGKALSLETSG